MRTIEPIRIIVTGGTLDKQYNQRTGELIFTRSHLTDILSQAHCTYPTEIETLMLKDSLYMVDEDRQAILGRCLAAPERRIIITHGTDTMTDTGHVLGTGLTDKTVVLVGAMIPYSFGASDALFNLGTAFAAVQALPSGVYVTMNGRIFNWDNVRKNREAGEFQEL